MLYGTALTIDPTSTELSFTEYEQRSTYSRIESLIGIIREQLTSDWAEDGGLTDVCRYALSAPGKYFRPILLLESAAAVGGDLRHVLPAAAGAEGAHVASLVHDDIIDGDELRRGLPAVHVAYGRDDAIVAGDALIFYLFAALASCAGNGIPAPRIVRAMAKAAEAGFELCQGQMMEEEIRDKADHRVSSYLRMIELKTAALFRGCCHIGATLGGGDAEQISSLARYGTALGVAFQIWDDLLPYLSSAADTGKLDSSDLANQRLILPFLLCRADADSQLTAELDRILHAGTEDDLEVRHKALSGLLIGSGAVDKAKEIAHGYANEALLALSCLADSESRTTLSYFAKATVARNR